MLVKFKLFNLTLKKALVSLLKQKLHENSIELSKPKLIALNEVPSTLIRGMDQSISKHNTNNFELFLFLCSI